MQSRDQSAYTGIGELEESSRFLVGYNRYVAKLFWTTSKKYNITSGSRVCEFGAGTGTLSEIYAERTGEKPDCIEIDSTLIKILEKKGFQTYKNLETAPNCFDFIYTSNVLEHIRDDSQTLSEIYKKLNSNGILAIYVPALQILYSDLDARIGHYRRYSRAELRQKLILAGFEIKKNHYVDSIGFFAALLTKMLGYQGKLGLGNSKSLQVYDQMIFPISRVCDSIGFSNLFGKNLFFVARKKDDN